MIKIYRTMFDLYHGIGKFIETSLTQSGGEPMHYPFMSLCVDPDSLPPADRNRLRIGRDDLFEFDGNSSARGCSRRA